MSGKGLIHIYCGGGKGKTTAALGQALRALGWKKNVLIFQFLKNSNFPCGEIKAIEKLGTGFKIIRFNQEHPMFAKLKKKSRISQLRDSINDSLEVVKMAFLSKKHDLIILDEILNAVGEGFVEEEKIVNLIKAKPEHLELIMTGRCLPEKISALADYISRVTEIRHPFKAGVKARKGIEY